MDLRCSTNLLKLAAESSRDGNRTFTIGDSPPDIDVHSAGNGDLVDWFLKPAVLYKKPCAEVCVTYWPNARTLWIEYCVMCGLVDS